jgi:hypothetical protein
MAVMRFIHYWRIGRAVFWLYRNRVAGTDARLQLADSDDGHTSTEGELADNLEELVQECR